VDRSAKLRTRAPAPGNHLQMLRLSGDPARRLPRRPTESSRTIRARSCAITTAHRSANENDELADERSQTGAAAGSGGNVPVVGRRLHGALKVPFGAFLLLARLPDDASVEAEQVGIARRRQQPARVARLCAREVALHLMEVRAVVAQQQRVLRVQTQHAVVVIAHPAPAVVAASLAARAAGSVLPRAGAVEEVAVPALVIEGLEDGRDRGVEEDSGSRDDGEVGPGAAEREGGRRGRAG
jgi:hypothetical protein